MMDIVAELNTWLEKDPWRGMLDRQTCQRTRDELVAQRVHAAKCMRVSGCADARAEALEEAAQKCREIAAQVGGYESVGADLCVFAIRTLKEMPHE